MQQENIPVPPAASVSVISAPLRNTRSGCLSAVVHSRVHCERWNSRHVPIYATTFKEMFVTHPKLVHHFL
jgi:hypothetical protein